MRRWNVTRFGELAYLRSAPRAIVMARSSSPSLSDDTLTEGEDERAMTIARGALRKYASSPNRVTFQRRMGSYLQRRGFSFQTIGPILDTLWNEVQGAAEEEEEETEISE